MGFLGYRFSAKPVMVSALVLLLALPSLGSAQGFMGPVRVIQQIADQLRTVLERDKDKLESDPGYVYQLANEILVPYIDFNRVSSLVLGKHWRRASGAQKTAFSKQFQRLLVRTYSTAFHEFQHWEIGYTPVRMAEGASDVSVHTRVVRSDAAPVSVVYRMHNRSGGWMAYDVKIEGISLITNYRSRFSREVRKGGMKGLISLLTKLNDKRAAAANVAQKS